MNRRQLLALSAGALTAPADLLGKLGAPEEDTGCTGLLDPRARMLAYIKQSVTESLREQLGPLPEPPRDGYASLFPTCSVEVDSSRITQGALVVYLRPRVLTIDVEFEIHIGADV